MENNLDLQAIEKKSYTSYFENGLLEIFFGLFFLATGINSLLWNDSEIMLMVLSVIPVLFYLLGHWLITIPRLGRVKFLRRRQVNQLKATLVLLVPLLLGVALSVAYSLPGLPQWLAWIKGNIFPWLVGLMVISTFAAIAYLIGLVRIFFIGLAMALNLSGRALLRTPLVHFAAAAFLLVPGIIMLILFLRRYPLRSGESLEQEAR